MGFMSALVNAPIVLILALTLVSAVSGLDNGGFNFRNKPMYPIQDIARIIYEPFIALMPTEAPAADPPKEPTQELAADPAPTASASASGARLLPVQGSSAGPSSTTSPTVAPPSVGLTDTLGTPDASTSTQAPTTTTGTPTVIPGSPSVAPSSGPPSRGDSTTANPSATRGFRSVSPSFENLTTRALTTGATTVTSGSPSVATTDSLTLASTTEGPSVTPGSPSGSPSVAQSTAPSTPGSNVMTLVSPSESPTSFFAMRDQGKLAAPTSVPNMAVLGASALIFVTGCVALFALPRRRARTKQGNKILEKELLADAVPGEVKPNPGVSNEVTILQVSSLESEASDASTDYVVMKS